MVLEIQLNWTQNHYRLKVFLTRQFFNADKKVLLFFFPETRTVGAKASNNGGEAANFCELKFKCQTSQVLGVSNFPQISCFNIE